MIYPSRVEFSKSFQIDKIYIIHDMIVAISIKAGNEHLIIQC